MKTDLECAGCHEMIAVEHLIFRPSGVSAVRGYAGENPGWLGAIYVAPGEIPFRCPNCDGGRWTVGRMLRCLTCGHARWVQLNLATPEAQANIGDRFRRYCEACGTTKEHERIADRRRHERRQGDRRQTLVPAD